MLCNAEFVAVGEEVYVIATKKSKVGDEIFIYY